MTDKTEEPCPACDIAMLKINGDYYKRLCDLEEDLQKKLAAVAEAHRRGEHENSCNLEALSK